jgi:hypothetical protein
MVPLLLYVPFVTVHRVNPEAKWRDQMARISRLVCDECGKEVDDAKGALMRVNFTDARKASKQADLCDSCAEKMPGHSVARRGRKPKGRAVA